MSNPLISSFDSLIDYTFPVEWNLYPTEVKDPLPSESSHQLLFNSIVPLALERDIGHLPQADIELFEPTLSFQQIHEIQHVAHSTLSQENAFRLGDFKTHLKARNCWLCDSPNLVVNTKNKNDSFLCKKDPNTSHFLNEIAKVVKNFRNRCSLKRQTLSALVGVRVCTIAGIEQANLYNQNKISQIFEYLERYNIQTSDFLISIINKHRFKFKILDSIVNCPDEKALDSEKNHLSSSQAVSQFVSDVSLSSSACVNGRKRPLTTLTKHIQHKWCWLCDGQSRGYFTDKKSSFLCRDDTNLQKFLEKVANEVKEFRSRRGWTQKRMDETFGLTNKKICAIEQKISYNQNVIFKVFEQMTSQDFLCKPLLSIVNAYR